MGSEVLVDLKSQLFTMSLVSALKRSLANSIMTPGRNLLSMSGGCNKVTRARHDWSSLDTQVHDIAPGRKIAYKSLNEGRKPTIVHVPGHHDKFFMNGLREMALMR